MLLIEEAHLTVHDAAVFIVELLLIILSNHFMSFKIRNICHLFA